MTALPKDHQPTANVPLSLVEGAIVTTALSFVHAVLHHNETAANESLKAMRVNIRNVKSCGIIGLIQTRIAAAVRDLPSDCKVLNLVLEDDTLIPLEAMERRRAAKSN